MRARGADLGPGLLLLLDDQAGDGAADSDGPPVPADGDDGQEDELEELDGGLGDYEPGEAMDRHGAPFRGV